MLYIIFPRPGNWDKYKIVCQWVDAGGYTHTESHGGVPAEFVSIMQQVVGSIVGLAEPWRAVLVEGSLVRIEPEEGGAQFEPYELVELTVHARKDGTANATRVFTAEDYPAFRIEDAGAVAFYKHFTHTTE